MRFAASVGRRHACFMAMGCTTFIAVGIAYAQRTYPPRLDDAEALVYKRAGDVELKLYVFSPAEDKAAADSPRPAVIFFFGGGWANGSPQQFEQQCRYLASRGIVAVTADYRVSSRHAVRAVDCVRDAKSAVRWLRAHAAELHVDPDRIAAAGGSAGGHIAACTATLDDFDEPAEDGAVSSKPNALVLFNPVASFDPAVIRDNPRVKRFGQRLGVPPEQLSPANNIGAGAPPTLVLVGSEDYVLAGVRQFVEQMTAAGNRCELDLYDGRSHGFFNYGRSGNKDFLATTESMDRFLASLGYLAGPPTVREYFAHQTPNPAAQKPAK